MAHEAYQVAVKIALHDQVTKGLMGLSTQFGIAGREADKLQKKLDNIKKFAILGAGLGAAGFFGLGMFAKAMKPAEDYAHQLNIMNMAGMKHQEIAEAVSAAWKTTTTVLTSTAVGNLKSFMDLRNIFGHTGEAIQYLPEIERIKAVLKASSESSVRQSGDTLAYSLAKALDIRGAVNSPAQFNQQAEMMAKVIVATQGRVLPQDYQMLFKYARQSTYGLSNQFLYEELPTFIQEMKTSGGGGSSHGGFGTSLAAGYRFFVQGIMTKRSAEELQELGLISKGAALKTTTTGTILKGGVKGADLFQSDPFQWVQHILLPALHQKYGNDLTKAQLIMAINKLRMPQTGAFEVLQFALKSQQVYRDQHLIQMAHSPTEAYKMALSNDPTTVNAAMSAQWENLKTQFMMGMVPILLPIIVNLAEAFNSLAIAMREHPQLVKILAIGFVALFTAMVSVGSILLTGAAANSLIVGFRLLRLALIPILLPLGEFAGVLLLLGGALYAISKNWGNIQQKLGIGTKYGLSNIAGLNDLGHPHPSSAVNHHHIFLDGKKFATVVTKHQANAASQQPAHGSSFNGHLFLQPNMLNASQTL